MKKILILFTLVYNTTGYSQPQPDYEKVAKACELWGLVKYFHPSRPTSKFDSAFAAQVPGMLKATSDKEWKNLIVDWLKMLNDPAIRIVEKVNFPIGDLTATFTNDSILVVKIYGSKFYDDIFFSRRFLLRLTELSKKSKGVIFDLRQDNEVPSRYEGTINEYFDYFGINKNFGTDLVPKYKTIYYSGFRPERGVTSADYTVNEVFRNGIPPNRANSKSVKTVWVINQFSELPYVALSQQSKGNGFILSDIESIDRLLPVSKTFQFSDNISLKIRTADVIMPALTEIRADYKYASSDDVIEKAREFLLRSAVVKPKPLAKNSSTSDETNLYPPQVYPTIGYRVLAAAKIFTVIQNFFPYHQYMDKNWGQVLKEALPDFVNAKDEYGYGLAVARMYANIQDSHGFISGNKAIEKLNGEAPPPVSVDWIEDRVVITRLRNDSICKINGIRIGDVILKINGIAIEKLAEKYRMYYAHSTDQDINLTVARYGIRGPQGTEGIFTIQDEKGKTKDIKLSWDNAHNKNFSVKHLLDTMALLDGNIGYADLTRMEVKQTDRMFEKFKNTKAIIFDMRGYPNGTAWSIAPRLTDKKNVPLALFRKPEIISPNIVSSNTVSSKSYTEFVQTVPPSDKWKYTGKTVMLINNNAISQSEHTGLFFEAVNNTTFVGGPTVGANGDVTNFSIPGGMFLVFSGQGVWHADGRQLQRLGLQPHVPVMPTLKGIRSGKDEILDKAKEWIRKNVH